MAGPDMRRILKQGDQGDDVRMVQHALNWALISLPPLTNPADDWRADHKLKYPSLWGYRLGSGGDDGGPRLSLADSLRLNPPVSFPRINESGVFDTDTYLGVRLFQLRQGLDDTGDVDVATWERLFPWFLICISLKPIKDTPASDSPPPTAPPPAGPSDADTSVYARYEGGSEGQGSGADDDSGWQRQYQLGSQTDNTVATVFQLTYAHKPGHPAFLPGHWEQSGGLQLNVPYTIATGSGPGKNLQVYYQLTRADVWKVGSLSLANPFVQPFYQQPLDSGTDNNKLVGVNAGNTINWDLPPVIKRAFGFDEKAKLTLFGQGASTLTYDPQKKELKLGGQGFVGIQGEF